MASLNFFRARFRGLLLFTAAQAASCLSTNIFLRGIIGECFSGKIGAAGKVQLGGISTTLRAAVAFDLTPISNHHSFQISGFAGFPSYAN